MAKETFTESMTVAKDPQDSKAAKPKTSFIGFIADKGIFVFTGILVLTAVLFVDGFASLQKFVDIRLCQQ